MGIRQDSGVLWRIRFSHYSTVRYDELSADVDAELARTKSLYSGMAKSYPQ